MLPRDPAGEENHRKHVEDALAGEDFLVGAIHLTLCMDKNGKQYLSVAASGDLTKFQSLGMLSVAQARLVDMEV